MKQLVDNIIFISSPINLRAGGPCGYIANLNIGLSNIPNNNIVVIHDNRNSSIEKIHTIWIKIIASLIPIKKYRKKIKTALTNIIIGVKYNWTDIEAPFDKYFEQQLDKYNFKTITCHCCKDVMWIKQYLNKRKLNAKIIQMSHSPSLPSIEIRDIFSQHNRKDTLSTFNIWQDFEKKSFYSADVILAPAEESLETYKNDAPYFDDLLKKKAIKYLPTGCKQLTTDYSKDDLRKKYNIKTKFVISYVGRHIPVRGYDILKKIGEQLLKERNDVTFLIAGNLEDAYPPLEHERWIEVGYTNPADIIHCSDLFISPGRQAYFDLVLLEAMSCGVNIITSNVQGNKAVFKQTNAITLCNNFQDYLNEINNFLNLNNEQRKLKQNDVLNAYLSNYTIDIFAKNYVKLIKELCDETN